MGNPAGQFVHPANSFRHSGFRRNPEGWGEGIVAPGLVPSLGWTARSRKLHGPAYHHFHPLMRPSQGHGDSRAGGNHAPWRRTRTALEKPESTPTNNHRPRPLVSTATVEYHRLELAPTNPARIELDERLVRDMLGLDEDAAATVARLRTLLATDPSIHGSKKPELP